MNNLEVNLESGRIRGFVQGGVRKFWGIPYCLPPIGQRRFQPADPTVQWDGVLDATKHYAIAPQGTSDLDGPMGPTLGNQNEDCLVINVTAPLNGERLPVAVWFHGGANCYGGGDLDWYDPESLVRKGKIVVVNVNYRLGALGYLYHPNINESNLAIGDMLTALKWVQRNIAMFGGDASNVTVFGQSAGANAIIHMLSIPETESLFSAAILESPSIGRGNHTVADAKRIAECLCSHLDITTENPVQMKEGLLAASTSDILKAMDETMVDIGKEYGLMLFRPVKNEWHTPKETIEAALHEAERRSLPIMIGTTRDELHAFALERDPASLQSIKKIQSQRFDGPALEFAYRLSDAGCPVWKYRFDWQAPNSVYDSCHCLELPFVFGALDAWKDAPMLKGMSYLEGEKLKDTLQANWIQFIKHHSFCEDQWPKLTKETSFHKIFNNLDNPIQSIYPSKE